MTAQGRKSNLELTIFRSFLNLTGGPNDAISLFAVFLVYFPHTRQIKCTQLLHRQLDCALPLCKEDGNNSTTTATTITTTTYNL